MVPESAAVPYEKFNYDVVELSYFNLFTTG